MKTIKPIYLLLILILFIPILTATSHALEHESYAILFSGGGDKDSNYTRYYDETLRMWRIMTSTLGFDYDKVYVLFADGLNPDDDRCVGWDTTDPNNPVCNKWENSDWSEIESENGVILSATYNDLKESIDTIAGLVTLNDSFHFWSFDHGYNETYNSRLQDIGAYPYGSTHNLGGLVAWGGLIPDDVFASWVQDINAMAEDYIFAECFAGDMVDNLNIIQGDHEFAAWAADWYEPSWGQGWADAWADGLESGLRSTWSLGQYALEKDPFSKPYGDWGNEKEHPGWTGYNFNIVSNQAAVPEPSTFLLLAAGLAGLAFVRRKTRS